MKVKMRREGVFIVGGIRNVDAFDGVLVGEMVDGDLIYRGVVEWGFKAHDVLRLLAHAKDSSHGVSPFADLKTARNVIWMEPKLRPGISYAEMMSGKLRAPSWRRLVERATAPGARAGWSMPQRPGDPDADLPRCPVAADSLLE